MNSSPVCLFVFQKTIPAKTSASVTQTTLHSVASRYVTAWARRFMTPRSRASIKRMKTPRSEEHTSELQSPCNLVCRLLLEKKKHHHVHVYPPRHTHHTYTTHLTPKQHLHHYRSTPIRSILHSTTRPTRLTYPS